ncbi:MAG: STAS domain-containing protein [Acidimicrobiales bacterium]|nr:STAS domain-containing protein [Acidimicrobiales bacterium]
MVWVRGDHDPATRVHLSDTIALAARLDDVNVVVDLSGVTFMDASTIGAIVDAYNCLRGRSRLLSIRAPSARARRLLDVCDLGFLIDEHPAASQPPVAPALDSWVAVPASDRDPDTTESSAAHETPLPGTRSRPGRATSRAGRVGPQQLRTSS